MKTHVEFRDPISPSSVLFAGEELPVPAKGDLVEYAAERYAVHSVCFRYLIRRAPRQVVVVVFLTSTNPTLGAVSGVA